jgi:hypothetical protein
MDTYKKLLTIAFFPNKHTVVTYFGLTCCTPYNKKRLTGFTVKVSQHVLDLKII